VVTSHLPYHSWAAVRDLYREICQEVGPSSSSSVRFKVDQQPNFTIIAFFTWPAHSKIYVEGGGGGDLYHSISSSTLKETFPFFEFLCTKTNPHFSINKAALDLFHSIRGSLPYLKSQVPLWPQNSFLFFFCFFTSHYYTSKLDKSISMNCNCWSIVKQTALTTPNFLKSPITCQTNCFNNS
jgi:hypothetical protein